MSLHLLHRWSAMLDVASFWHPAQLLARGCLSPGRLRRGLGSLLGGRLLSILSAL